MNDFLLTLTLCASTMLSLWNPVVHTRETYLNDWNDHSPNPFEVSWSVMTGGIWVLYSTVQLHELTLLVLKLIALLVESCCFAAVINKFPAANKGSLMEFIFFICGVLPPTLLGVALIFGAHGIGAVGSFMHSSLLVWKLRNIKGALNKDYKGQHSSLHACLYASNALVWCLYAYYKNDSILMYPNMILGVGGMVETAVLWMQNKKKQDPAKQPLIGS